MKKNFFKLAVLSLFFITSCERSEIETQTSADVNQTVSEEVSKNSQNETTQKTGNTARTITVTAAAFTKEGAKSKALAKLGNAKNKRITDVRHMIQFPLWQATATGTN